MKKINKFLKYIFLKLFNVMNKLFIINSYKQIYFNIRLFLISNIYTFLENTNLNNKNIF